MGRFGERDGGSSDPPILIAGGTGALGSAVARACEMRGLRAVAVAGISLISRARTESSARWTSGARGPSSTPLDTHESTMRKLTATPAGV